MKKSSYFIVPFTKNESIEVLKSTTSNKSYPAHKHDCYCFSIIYTGIFRENKNLVYSNQLLITHPNEVHANDIIDDFTYSMTTFYINQDVVKFVLNRSYTTKFSDVIDDVLVVRAFKVLSASISDRASNNTAPSNINYESALVSAIKMLQPYTLNVPEDVLEENPLITDIQFFLEKNLRNKVSLDELSIVNHLDKYQLIRKFKKQVGMTPIQYVMMQRVIQAQRLIKTGAPLSDVALSVGFYDQSNFSNYFKFYTGITPKTYQNAVCNIFQDLRY